jgi:hypothetical protein
MKNFKFKYKSTWFFYTYFIQLESYFYIFCLCSPWVYSELPETKSLTNCLAAGPWSIGTKWPALFTILS